LRRWEMKRRNDETTKRRRKSMRPSIMIAAALAAGLSAPASAEDAYVVGITAALTGPPASTYAPAVEALRLYLEQVNAAGGVNGKKVRLAIEDDSAQPSKAAANAKKLLAEDNPVLLLNASLSSTYAPVIAEAKTAGVPLMFASSVCPKDVYPPAQEGEFCTTAFAATYDSRAALAFVKETAKEAVKIGFSAMAIPLSRGEMDFAES
jgi:branched-chain amino acid transport system substrate-binding protein